MEIYVIILWLLLHKETHLSIERKKKMGKKKQVVNYDKKALENLVAHIESARQPFKGLNIPKLKIDREALENTVKGLPKKEREVMEKFWGLIPGTPIQAKDIVKRIGKNLALKNMLDEAYSIVEKLISVEYLYQFDMGVQKLVQEIVTKIDKKDLENIDDISTIKYFLIFLVFFAGGHQMIYDTEGIQPMTQEEEKVGRFDKYALLKAAWESTTKNLPDHSISLRLIISMIEMFDVKDIIAMKRYVFLPIEREYEGLQTETVVTFQQIRTFKEKIFGSGPWNMTYLLIYGQQIERGEVEKLSKHFKEFRSDWNSLEKYKKEEDAVMITSKGEVTLPLYEVEGLQFTDSYEVMFLYLNRNVLL